MCQGRRVSQLRIRFSPKYPWPPSQQEWLPGLPPYNPGQSRPRVGPSGQCWVLLLSIPTPWAPSLKPLSKEGVLMPLPPQSPRVQCRQKAHLIDSSSLVDLRKRRHGSGRGTWDQTLLQAPVQAQAGASSLENAQYCVPPSLSLLLRADAAQPSSVRAGRRVGVQHPFQGFYRGNAEQTEGTVGSPPRPPSLPLSPFLLSGCFFP